MVLTSRSRRPGVSVRKSKDIVIWVNELSRAEQKGNAHMDAISAMDR